MTALEPTPFAGTGIDVVGMPIYEQISSEFFGVRCAPMRLANRQVACRVATVRRRLRTVAGRRSSPEDRRMARRNWPPIIERFLDKIEVADNGCWIWTASTDGDGRYGGFGNGHGRIVRAHRWSYEFFVGPIPDGLVLDHVRERGCTSTLCVNPDHLEPVTQAENNRRAVTSNPPACVNGHAYTPENSVTNSQGSRICRTCQREQGRRRQREYRARKRAA